MKNILDNLLRLSSENEVVEFKEAKKTYAKDDLGKYFSALSNEANLNGQRSAYFVMGVKNDRSIAGTNINDDQLNEYKAEMARHTSPRSSFIAVYRIDQGEKDVLLFEIPAAPQGQPMSWKGHYYGRDGESLGALSQIEYDTIRTQLNQKDWSAHIVQDATIDDLSKEAIDFAKLQYKEKHPKLKGDIDLWSDAVFLDKAKITIKGRITNTAILLLGQPESEHFINPSMARVTWILKDKDNTEKDYEHFYSPFLLAVENINSKIRNLKYRYIKSGTLFPGLAQLK